MKKLWLIIKREYLIRVRKKTFIVATILTPIAIIAIYTLPILFMKFTTEKQKIAVKDDSGIINALPSSDKAHFDIVTKDLEELRKEYKDDGYNGVLYVPSIKNLNNDVKIQYYSDEQISMSNKGFLEGRIGKKIRDYKMKEAGLTEQQLEQLETNVTLAQKKQTINEDGTIEEEESESSAALATAMGMGMAFAMYFVIFIYGMMVMRSVMEEKVNRIVEVIISSVKPFQLMLGKIIGVSGVGLTQLLIWIGCLMLFWFLALPLLIPSIASGAPSPDELGVSAEEMEEQMAWMEIMARDIASQNWAFLIPVLIIFFLGGYFIYASLFAAVGSAIGDDQGESQTLTLPIVLPVIVGLFIAMTIIDNPNSGLAVFGSMFPLFSPIVMPARLAFDPPLWEVLLSIAILIGSVIFFVWLSGRIYRIGIFMYGKKVTFKEIAKWLFYKG